MSAPGKSHRVEYRNRLGQPWLTDLPDSLFAPTREAETLGFTGAVNLSGIRLFRVSEF